MTSPTKSRVVLLPGDGIGPEVVAAARAVLERAASLGGHHIEFDERLLGGCAIDATGEPLPAATLEACRRADAALLGAVGGPRWDDPRAAVRPEGGLLAIRRELGLYANLRPIRTWPELADASPLKSDRLAGVDILFVRELTGGLYFGPRARERDERGERAYDTMLYSEGEIRRVVSLGFRLAAGRRKRLTSVDKANVLESSRLWRQIAIELAAEHPAIALDHQLVDSAAMRIIVSPGAFDVIVTENMFGDILTDEASVLSGSLGLLPSASLGEGRFGLYEPIHGSAPDIAGTGAANPLGAILSAAMLLRHSLGLEAEAAAVERAVDTAIASGARTRDLGGTLTTEQMTAAVLRGLAA
jgi:3-isopropylmalate dehydrogenase